MNAGKRGALAAAITLESGVPPSLSGDLNRKSRRMKLQSLLILSALALGGCASGPPPAPLSEASSAPLAAPPADQAQIIFVDPANAIQGAIPTFVFELRGTDRTLLGVMGPHSKMVQLVAPGHHVFASNGASTSAHILEADVAAGKRYYVLLRFVYANGFQLRPIRPTGPSEYAATNKEFGDWVTSTSYVVKTAAGDAFAEKHAAGFAKEQAAGLAEWGKKLPVQRAELTLNASDTIER
jgi:hypothetical protein